jgi:sugar transferase (PEP-CTERM/EpsH1 system associated)
LSVPLIVHVVHHFDVGGLENGMVNLLNRMPEERYRHAVVCMRGFTDYRKKIRNQNVRFYALDKKPGKDIAVYHRMFQVLRQVKPAIVHTRNLSGLEGQFVAAFSGVRARVHSEHGRDGADLHGRNGKYNLLRKVARPLVHRYIALSRDLEHWLVDTIGVAPQKIAQVYNGVDTDRFYACQRPRAEFGPPGFIHGSELVIGSVGRMAEVKDFPTLVTAFLRVISAHSELRSRLRLVIVGEGPTRQVCQALIDQAGASDIAWLPGERADVPDLMRAFDLLVLPSLGEGISNTILEAMASSLPVVATRVGGNPELVEDHVTGRLVEPRAPQALAQALLQYASSPELIRQHGYAARARAEANFSMDAMLKGYVDVYDAVLAGR